MKAQDVAVRVRELLIDEGVAPVNSDAKMLRYINDATVAILNVKPTANVVAETMSLEQGSVQRLADRRIYLHDVPYALQSGVPGSSIRRVARDQMDQFVPGWRSRPQVAAPVHFMYDDYNPKAFEVYPPSNGAGSVAVHVTVIPDSVGSLEDELGLPGDFIDAYVYYVASRIVDADSDEVGNERRADRFFARFAEMLGVKIQNRVTFSANMRER